MNDLQKITHSDPATIESKVVAQPTTTTPSKKEEATSPASSSTPNSRKPTTPVKMALTESSGSEPAAVFDLGSRDKGMQAQLAEAIPLAEAGRTVTAHGIGERQGAKVARFAEILKQRVGWLHVHCELGTHTFPPRSPKDGQNGVRQ
jgi:hypothetical protein